MSELPSQSLHILAKEQAWEAKNKSQSHLPCLILALTVLPALAAFVLDLFSE
ncbi:MAG: hypothetical protein ACI9DC_002330 [Gammaproteobacteria bacterium]|jgi:hypothetical protein